jgi:hypothetical protein
MSKQKALILGKAYSYSDAKLTLYGIEIFSCTQITATVTQEKRNNPGMGDKAASRGRGIKNYEVSFDLSEKDVERLAAQSPTEDLTDLPMTTGIILLDNGTDKVSFQLVAFEFGSDGLEGAVEDTEFKRSFGGICADIIRTKLT